MAFPDEPQGAETPQGEAVFVEPPSDQARSVGGEVITDPHAQYDVDYHDGDWSSSTTYPSEPVALPPPPVSPPRALPGGGGGKPPQPPDPPDPPDEDEDDEDGMTRMSFMEHLEELRSRLLKAIGGIAVAGVACLFLGPQLWDVIRQPAKRALENLNVHPPNLILIDPMDAFQIIWMKIPLLCAIFVASPWVLYQVWAFISPGLYRKEKKWAVPFVVSSSLLFILGGLFAYFVAFRYGLEFLLGLGIGSGITPGIDVNKYYDLFVDVMLGVGMIFEIPVLLFLLTLIRVASPAFLVRHSRYAILAIVILAAVITPTGDVFNLSLFATPMIILFYIGIFASYLLVLHREKRRFPWGIFIKWTLLVLVVLLAIGFAVAWYFGYHFAKQWPFLVR